ncbi:helix-turn-helix transcriptional regulator [Catelliglobosispora koreensis]|uniref:helix-turn-helix transcriptional regulator n=1 Tax=Catelliglobosispora koreensis TaxID=129052 RepID=UPI00036BC521|nr:helix-turn-helix transcriptional regulator [Catelliglobosispora koreensis]
MDRPGLAEFLRTRRDRMTPLDVGLPGTGRRRTPGLRREEVAQLARMSSDYYTRLEQARGPHPSRQILNALARALMLSTDERAHLFHLAGQTPAPARGPRQDVPEGILHLLAGLDNTTPAYVLDAKYNILAWNEMMSVLLGGISNTNLIRSIFADNLCGHANDEFARGAVADLRAASARYPDDKGIRDLVSEMLALSKEFAGIWAEHDVEVRRDSRKTLVHPVVGPIELLWQVLHIPDRDQRVVLYTAAPGSQAQSALCELRRLTPNSYKNSPR